MGPHPHAQKDRPLERRLSRPADALLEITVREGRNRQVRRMCEAIGHPVTELTRVAIGPIRDAKLKTGQWRDLTDGEIERLKKAANPDGR